MLQVVFSCWNCGWTKILLQTFFFSTLWRLKFWHLFNVLLCARVPYTQHQAPYRTFCMVKQTIDQSKNNRVQSTLVLIFFGRSTKQVNYRFVQVSWTSVRLKPFLRLLEDSSVYNSIIVLKWAEVSEKSSSVLKMFLD